MPQEVLLDWTMLSSCFKLCVALGKVCCEPVHYLDCWSLAGWSLCPSFSCKDCEYFKFYLVSFNICFVALWYFKHCLKWECFILPDDDIASCSGRFFGESENFPVVTQWPISWYYWTIWSPLNFPWRINKCLSLLTHSDLCVGYALYHNKSKKWIEMIKLRQWSKNYCYCAAIFFRM